ncbi:DUF6484 domain-containing protein [Roseateles chitinivorans]|uniref:DUF6484 domain-containing protein n=1 Tax=Roseateles chitinivorans TaxID=2917965 RepID=UPI003D66FF5E
MERLDMPAHGVDTAAQDASPFDVLLNQGAQVAALPAPGQVIIGTLQTVPAQGIAGSAMVPGLGLVGVAHSLVPLSAEHEGQGVALSVLAEGAAIVLGLLWNGEAAQEPRPAPPDHDEEPEGLAITVDGHREVIEAAEELELRCGEACIVLTADGRIQLRGTYITSHASATQRIVGGSVHVN